MCVVLRFDPNPGKHMDEKHTRVPQANRNQDLIRGSHDCERVGGRSRTRTSCRTIDKGYSGKALALINRCQMHMKALYRSNLSNLRGTEITEEVYNVTEPICDSISGREYIWQHQGRPSAADRTMWRKFLKKVYKITREYREWENPCSRWKEKSLAHFKWTYGSDDILYEKTDNDAKWRIWKR